MNKLIPIIAAVIIVGGGSFYAGMKYDQNQSSAARGRNFGSLSQGRGQQGMGMRGGGGFVIGDVVTKDDKSITVKLRDGGSSIVFFTASTTVVKSTEGGAQGVVIGKQVSVMGTKNQDGSVNAQSIQIRSDMGNRATQ